MYYKFINLLLLTLFFSPSRSNAIEYLLVRLRFWQSRFCHRVLRKLFKKVNHLTLLPFRLFRLGLCFRGDFLPKGHHEILFSLFFSLSLFGSIGEFNLFILSVYFIIKKRHFVVEVEIVAEFDRFLETWKLTVVAVKEFFTQF